MVESLRRFAGLTLARWHFRSRSDDVVSFTRAISNARHALLIMPFNKVDTAPVTPVVNLLRQRLQERHITVVTPIHSVELMHLLPQGRFIRVEEQDINRLMLPKPAMMQRMPRSEYDVAIDLNLDFVLPSGYICRESKAKVRIGFAGDRSDLFYNFILRLPPVAGKRQLYERLATCLAMF